LEARQGPRPFGVAINFLNLKQLGLVLLPACRCRRLSGSEAAAGQLLSTVEKGALLHQSYRQLEPNVV
jgi:hypothetical protein